MRAVLDKMTWRIGTKILGIGHYKAWYTFSNICHFETKEAQRCLVWAKWHFMQNVKKDWAVFDEIISRIGTKILGIDYSKPKLFKCSDFPFPTFAIGVKVIEVVHMCKMRLDTKCKQALSGAPGNDLTNRDQNFGYWSLQSLNFWNCSGILFPRLPFWGLKVTEVSFFSNVRLKWPYQHRPKFRVSITPKSKIFYCSGFLFPSFEILRPEMDRGVVFPQN